MKPTHYLVLVLGVALGLAACQPRTPTVKEVTQERFEPTYQLANDTLIDDYLEVLRRYNQIKQALADGNPTRSQAATDSLLLAAGRFVTDSPKDTTRLSQALRKAANDLRPPALAILQSGTLSDQRQHFYGLSQKLLAFVKDFGTAGLYLRQYTNPAALNNRPAFWFETDSLPDDPYGTPAGAQASLTAIYRSQYATPTP